MQAKLGERPFDLGRVGLCDDTQRIFAPLERTNACSDHAALRNGSLQPVLNSVQKPFGAEALSLKVRDALER